jgi:hypothetical protein
MYKKCAKDASAVRKQTGGIRDLHLRASVREVLNAKEKDDAK